jgi:hypothetical protein
MQLPLVEQLKSLKNERAGGSPDAQWLASTKETLMMQLGNTVGAESRGAGFRASADFLKIFLPKNLGAAIAVPLGMLALIAGAGASSTAVVAAAHDTLPGNAFYEVKLAAESVSLLTAGKNVRTERRLEIAGRRLDEMARLSTSADPDKDAKIQRVAALFSGEMNGIGADLDKLRQAKDTDLSVRVAMQVESKSDAYQNLFQNDLSLGRPTLRLALLSLDEASVKALEILVESRNLASAGLPEAELTSVVGRKIDTFAAHVAVTEDGLTSKGADSQSVILTTKAKAAVAEAKQLLSQGDFKAAVLKVSEGADLVTQAESADGKPPAPPDGSATGTTDSATQTPASGTPH